jgi:hypothetical protein
VGWRKALFHQNSVVPLSAEKATLVQLTKAYYDQKCKWERGEMVRFAFFLAPNKIEHLLHSCRTTSPKSDPSKL